MSEWSPAARRVGMWSAADVFLVSLMYVATGVAWLLCGGAPARTDPFSPADPYRRILEWLIVACVPPMVVMMGAIHAYARPSARVYSLSAFAFMVLLAGTTTGIHFVELSVVRRTALTASGELSALLAFRWPSVPFVLDLLAWDLFLGLSLLLAAPVFRGDGMETVVRRGMLLGGSLCVAGLLGPALGDLRFQVLAIVGYAGVFPAVCLMVAMLFRRAATA